MTTSFVIAIAALIACLQLPKLKRKQWNKEIAIYLTMLAAGTVLSIYGANLTTVPSPLNVLITIYGPINRLFGLMIDSSS